ncbi:MAG: class I SAM-dependent methyltransferase [Nostocaceae cyanobacterium]|nr:class I SAM-dependent methyltransferase [Nostocaceae cyanobacterium]
MDKNTIQAFYEDVYTEYLSENLHDFDSYERNHVLKRIYQQGNNKQLLDLGAGHGNTSKFFLDRGYEVYAIEWNTVGVQKLLKLGVKATQKDIEDVPYSYEDNFFDEVFWGDNIEHLFFPEQVAKEIYRILKPGGRLVLSTPNHGWIINRLYYFFMGVPRRTEGHKIPIWKWQHIRYFNKSEMRQFLNHCGFQKNFAFYGAERRQPFAFLSQYFPSIMGSVMVVEVFK